jgi:BCCT family betaine/carnitine transporter
MAEAGIPAPEGAATPIETDYKVGQHNIQRQFGPFGIDVHNPVFVVSGLTIIAFVLLTLFLQADAASVFTSLRDWLTAKFDWFFLLAGNVFVVLCLFLIVSPGCIPFRHVKERVIW